MYIYIYIHIYIYIYIVDLSLFPFSPEFLSSYGYQDWKMQKAEMRQKPREEPNGGNT